MKNKANTHAEHLTIMMLDLCGYTHLSSKLNRKTLHELHDLFDDIAIPAVKEHHGQIIKKMGDAFLATFKSPTNALHCSIALQNKFTEYNKINQPRFPLKIKIALHTGEIIVKEGDIYGDAVNITSRIESIAEAGDILFSNSLFLAMNKNEISSVYLGRRNFKGVNFPVKVYKVKPRRIRRRVSRNAFRNIAWWILFLVIIYLLFKVADKLF